MNWHHPMRRLAALATAGRRPAPPASPRRPGADADAINSSQAGLSLFLGLPDAQALAIACTAQSHRHAALAPDGTTAAAPWSCCPVAAGQVLMAALAHGPCLLALPFNRPALQLLRQLPGQVQAPVVIIDSPALGDSLARWRLPESVARCGVTDALQRAKAQAAAGALHGGRDGGLGRAAPVLYISFPELHLRSAGTTAQGVFLGQPTLLSLFEPLLCQHGLSTLLTMVLHTLPAGPALLLSPLRTAAAGPDSPDSPGAAPAAILRWLVGHLQTLARTLPEQTLSWPQLYRSSAHFQAIVRSNRLKQLAAFFDAWQASGSGLQGQTQAFVTAQLAALRSAL